VEAVVVFFAAGPGVGFDELAAAAVGDAGACIALVVDPEALQAGFRALD